MLLLIIIEIIFASIRYIELTEIISVSMPGSKYAWMWKEITEIGDALLIHMRNIITKYIARTHTHEVSFSLLMPNKTCFMRAFLSLIFLNDKRKGTFAPSGRFFFRCLLCTPIYSTCVYYSHRRIRVCCNALKL